MTPPRATKTTTTTTTTPPTATASPRSTKYLPLTDLRPDPRNPKSHDLETLDASVGRFGYIEPIIRDDRTGYIIAGHGRTKTLQAMHERGENPPEGIRVDADGTWLVPVGVGWSSRTDAEAAAALIALNRTTEMGGWVDDALLDLLDGLAADDGAGLTGVGFDEDDLADLRNHLDAHHADIDGLADEWDGKGMADFAMAKIVVTDPDLLAAWTDHREDHESDNDAMRALLQP